MTGVDSLFRPFQLNGLRLRNRVAMAPMTREFCPGGVPNSDNAKYYGRRAEGGVGLIITEGTGINSVGIRNNHIPRFYGDDALEGWRAVVDSVHAAGAAIFPQLWHIGVQQSSTVVNPDLISTGHEMIGPSGLDGLGQLAGRQMSLRDIDQTIEDFGVAAAAAQKIGCDGIELHGAHGYLLDQFKWSVTNKRIDSFGGNLAERARFSADVVAEIRHRTGPNFPIIYRFSQWKVTDYQAILVATPDELEKMLKPLVDAGVDLFDCSTRRFNTPAFAGSNRNLATWTKIVSGKPAMAVGSVTLDMDLFAGGVEAGISAAEPSLENFQDLVNALDAGDFDLVAIGRSLLANPDWVKKVQSGQIGQLRSFTKDFLHTLR